MVLFLCALFALTTPPLQLQITTSQYDNARTGANLHEATLTPSNVNTREFGKLFSYAVDGDVYAQPLYVPDVEIPGKGVHNLLFVATEADAVYAFDASGPSPEPAANAPLWRTSFANPAAGVTPVPAQIVNCPFIRPEVGITSTPVIDAKAGMIFVLARTEERDREGTHRLWQKLHALDIRTGVERAGSPVVIEGSVPGEKSFFGLLQSTVKFSPLRENPRSALVLVNGQVYLTWASSCDVGPYYGWVMSYDARTLKRTGIFNTAPEGHESGIWQSDTGPAADEQGNIYVLTGNGVFDVGAAGGRDYGDSVLRLSLARDGLAVRDYFTPRNQEERNRRDGDLGSGGPMLLPDQPGSRRLLVAAGKGDAIYLIDRNQMGKYSLSQDRIVQTVHDCGTGSFGAPAYWNGHVFYICRDDVLKDFVLRDGRLSLWRTADRSTEFGGPGATPAISANGATNGIVWAVECDVPGASTAILHAYDAADVSKELFNSRENADRDHAGVGVRFAIPTIADGHVYIGTNGEVDVYGLLPGAVKENETPRPRRRKRIMEAR
jgi:hypothetical protein